MAKSKDKSGPTQKNVQQFFRDNLGWCKWRHPGRKRVEQLEDKIEEAIQAFAEKDEAIRALKDEKAKLQKEIYRETIRISNQISTLYDLWRLNGLTPDVVKRLADLADAIDVLYAKEEKALKDTAK